MNQIPHRRLNQLQRITIGFDNKDLETFNDPKQNSMYIRVETDICIDCTAIGHLSVMLINLLAYIAHSLVSYS